ncbi:UNVERIFIED_CONTAM: Retrovirus-related Pol polyprotein from transposon opus [Sesamum angustifolium]|uniref:Retrovirus-related Pol polyprotein from transposon opus n=1 Tax=Sesamum angustifolium TaxID=2727405 RepID=A0AAW2JVG7_9LAMI
MKIKFLVIGGVGEAHAETLQARKCYVEAIKRGKKRKETKDSNKRERMPSPETDKEASARVQLVDELLTIELTLGDPGEGYENKIQDDRKYLKSSNQLPSKEQRYLCMDSPGTGGDRPRCHHAPPQLKPWCQAGATYQRLVDKILGPQLGRNMEVYVDDMLIKSEETRNHVEDLEETFAVLRKFKLKLNPGKCTFGVSGGRFQGFMVTQQGIEANPAKIKAILDIEPPQHQRSATANGKDGSA